MNEEQRYLFDAFGYFVIPDAVSQAQIEELRTTLQTPGEEADPGARLEAPLHWSQVWRDLLDLPALSPLLEELIGNHGRRADSFAGLPTFRIDHINVHTHVAKRFKGGILHGGWKGTGGSQFFRYHDGQFYNGLVAVVFELFDTHPNDGGFCCIPGTHKANLPLPTQWRDLSQASTPASSGCPRAPATPSCSPRHPPQRQAGARAPRRRHRVHRGVDPGRRHPAVMRRGTRTDSPAGEQRRTPVFSSPSAATGPRSTP